MDEALLYERRGEEVSRAMEEVARIEAQFDSLRERAENADYWMARAKRAESEVAGLQLELAKIEMNRG